MSLYLDILTLLCYLAYKKHEFGTILMLKSTKDKIQTTIYLPQSMHTKLRITALNEHTSMTKYIIRAIQRELKESGKDKESTN